MSRRHGYPHHRRWNHHRHLPKEDHHHRADPLAVAAVCVGSRQTFDLHLRRCLRDRSNLHHPGADLDPRDPETVQQCCSQHHPASAMHPQAYQEYPRELLGVGTQS